MAFQEKFMPTQLLKYRIRLFVQNASKAKKAKASAINISPKKEEKK